MKFSISLLFLIGSLAANATVEDGGSVGNGGDPIALDFLLNGAKVSNIVKEAKKIYPDPFTEVSDSELNEILNKVKLTVTDEKIWIIVDGKKIYPAAVNYPKTKEVYINRTAWKEIYNKTEKQSLVFHELLGLLGKELSGDYKISKRLHSIRGYQNAELLITNAPLPVIPSNGVSCYSHKITPPGKSPVADIVGNYFRIPQVHFFRSSTTKSLIISMIRITYALPDENGNAVTGRCEVAGDVLRALSSRWWKGGPEAVIPSKPNQGGDLFSTDCSLMCGDVSGKLPSGWKVKAEVEAFGFERDKFDNETPVRMDREITIETF